MNKLFYIIAIFSIVLLCSCESEEADTLSATDTDFRNEETEMISETEIISEKSEYTSDAGDLENYSEDGAEKIRYTLPATPED